jgi:hypothetical protein
MPGESQEPKKISPAPNWTEIFQRHPHLSPPGYEEAVAYYKNSPRLKKKELMWEAKVEKQKKKKLSRNQK